VADQIGHLTYFDANAALAVVDPDAFQDEMAALLGGGRSGDDITLGRYRAMSPDELLAAWRSNRDTLRAAGATLTNDTRIAWYGPSMGSKSFLTARLMEAWAHGQDIVDAVGATREPTDRLRHIAQLGFITRGWTYMNRGLDVPSTPVRVELTSPSGDTWSFGPDATHPAAESIVGPALDFCLVTTQRRHVDDTALVVTGSSARDWMEKAQLFAGPPSDGPGIFRRFGRGSLAEEGVLGSVERGEIGAARAARSTHLDRREGCPAIVGEDRLLVVGAGSDPHRGDQAQLTLLVANACIEHPGRDTRLRGTPGEGSVSLALDRGLVDEQRERHDREVRSGDDDERDVARRRRGKCRRPGRADGTVTTTEHGVDVGGVRALAGEPLAVLRNPRAVLRHRSRPFVDPAVSGNRP
jgi:uncharacterized protein (TIGR03084 family)